MYGSDVYVQHSQFVVLDGLVGYFPWHAMGRICWLCGLYSTDIALLYTTSLRSQLRNALSIVRISPLHYIYMTAS